MEPGTGLPIVEITPENSELVLATFTERLLSAGVFIEPETAAALNSLFLSIRNGTDKQGSVMGDDDEDNDSDERDYGEHMGEGDFGQPQGGNEYASSLQVFKQRVV